MKSKEKKFSPDTCGCRLVHRERVAAACDTALPDDEIMRLSELFKALGDVTRLRIILALDQGEMCVCDLAAFLGVTESAVSHQLRLLRQLHLVANRRKGPILYYRLDDDHVSQLVHIGLVHIRE
ncbi:MAG: metalloregulator ArsR/SmtB family transcription factor [Desulfobulbaceae bacterium]|nr:metalloregulator ArsR/SmtB family transcription factor [Desulfobulbaceae bacterium]